MDNNQTKQKVIAENIKLSRNLAKVYDIEHGYMRGNYLDKITDKEIDFILSFFDKNSANLDVLDIGGGTGFLAVKFLKKGCKVHVIDISEFMLDALKVKLDNLNRDSFNRELQDRIILSCGNAEDELNKCLQSGKRYDVVACAAFLHHIFNFEEILNQIMSLVKKGGVIYILNEPLKGICPPDYLDTFFNKVIYNRKDLIPAAIRGIFGREIFWDYNTRLADYHITYKDGKKGLPFGDILKSLEKNNFKIMRSEKYSLSNFKIFYLLNKYFFRSFNGWFKIIAKK